MLVRLRHRGPDDSDVVVTGGLTLGHRRLSVIDLSRAGRQPMAYQECYLTFNGEIYNFAKLRRELLRDGQSEDFQGYSDSEVLLHCLVRWGVAHTLTRLVGMFSFAFWDGTQLWLARDRLGQKPLYYGWCGEDFVFASELRAFREHPEFQGVIDRQALALYLKLGYVPNPFSIFCGISKLEPGHYYVGGASRQYWSHPVGCSRPMDDEEAKELVTQAIRQAVTDRLVADVPLGVLLSGGIDSSLITALAQEEQGKPIKTFSLGFETHEYDESRHAAAVASHLGTEHTEFRLSAGEARSLLTRLPEIHDEPFCDPSQIPTFLVCREARKEVTVALSGDDGDSQFLGYPRYFLCSSQWDRWGRLPSALRRSLSMGIESLPSRLLWLLGRLTFPTLGDRVRGLQELLRCESLLDNYLRLAGFWARPIRAQTFPEGISETFRSRLTYSENPLETLMFWDTQTLPDSVLTKVDRASMANSLEVRSPLLDHRLWELSWTLPLNMKFRNGAYKWILREILYQRVPRELVDRPKQGFCIPLADWLRGPFKSWAQELLSPQTMARHGLFRDDTTQRTWHEFQEWGFGWEQRIWSLAIFNQWRESFFR
jgi:asparagine synthase (glutamine-hydrolysing)